MLKSLPQEVYDQIDEARNHIGLECLLKYHGTTNDVVFPGNVQKQYVDNEGRMTVWCGDKMDLRFVMNKEMTERQRKFVFIPIPRTLPKMKTEFIAKTGEWTAHLEGMPIVVTANSEREAFEELMKSVAVKLLYDAGKTLDQLDKTT